MDRPSRGGDGDGAETDVSHPRQSRRPDPTPWVPEPLEPDRGRGTSTPGYMDVYAGSLTHLRTTVTTGLPLEPE